LNAVIEAEHLRKTFGLLVAVDDLSFSVAAGECFGILGPNGAGKTSTIRMVYAFSPPSGGTLHVLGLDITRQARAVKSRIGVCPQENNIDPDLNVLQNLEVFARYFDIPAAEATLRSRELLHFMALDHRENSRAVDLSGGMIRRLVMARALLNRPELLILDEPTTGLDPQSRHQVWERLEELRADGLSILLTTHNMDEASRLCDRLIIVDQGRLLIEGKPAELVRRHVGRHVIEIVDPAEGLPAFLRERGVRFENIGHRLIVDLEDGTALYREIEERFCDGGGCIMRMATLEDVFLRLTGRELRE
jgi:lipooligosaccharide transport system ATP-binding protein